MNRFISLLISGFVLSLTASAQNELRVDPAPGRLFGLMRPYEARFVAPIRLTNSRETARPSPLPSLRVV